MQVNNQLLYKKSYCNKWSMTASRGKFELVITLLLVYTSFLGCKKIVQVDPPITSTNNENVYNDDISAIGVLTGVYANMSKSNVNVTNGYLTNIFFTTGLLSDELMLFDPVDAIFSPYANNNLLSSESNTWANIYKMIFVCNSAVDGISNTATLTPEVKMQLLGEARFIRALCYFYLVNLYGDVPLAIGTDYTINRILPRTKAVDVYVQIQNDLSAAKELLSSGYLEGDLLTSTNSSPRIRPTKGVATALLARLYLYAKDYSKAEAEASLLINNTSLYSLVDLNSVFLKNNKEAIWQLQSVGIETSNSANTKEGVILKLPETGINSLYPVYLSPDLVSSFEYNDQRKVKWINSITANGFVYNYAYKYKFGRTNAPSAEYSTVFRLGEQYLIRAEARIQLGRIAEGIEDLNILRMRASDTTQSTSGQLPLLAENLSKNDALLAVENERRHELFTEWGHRWFDLKRTERINSILSVSKGSNWQSTDQLYPIPQSDIQQNPSLVGHQNPGYN